MKYNHLLMYFGRNKNCFSISFCFCCSNFKLDDSEWIEKRRPEALSVALVCSLEKKGGGCGHLLLPLEMGLLAAALVALEPCPNW